MHPLNSLTFLINAIGSYFNALFNQSHFQKKCLAYFETINFKISILFFDSQHWEMSLTLYFEAMKHISNL